MLKKTLIVIALSAVSAFAGATELDAREAAKEVIDLQDGSTLFVFDSGKMAVQSKYGRAVRTEPGTILKAADGREINMVGNEVALLEILLKQGSDSGSASDSPS
jgi:hypothetical protein